MSCISVRASLIGGGVSSRVERVGGMKARLTRSGGMAVTAVNTAKMVANAAVIGRMTVEVFPVCTVDLRGKYLEIEPKIVWMWDTPAYNDVYSNTNWNID